VQLRLSLLAAHALTVVSLCRGSCLLQLLLSAATLNGGAAEVVLAQPCVQLQTQRTGQL
jgi:hypothetical protein